MDFVSNSYSSYSDISFRGSGGIIANDGGVAYVLTAHHVWQRLMAHELSALGLNQEIDIVDSAGEVQQAEISLLSPVFDLCVLEFETDKEYTPIPVSNEGLYLDEKAYMYAAPSGFFAALIAIEILVVAVELAIVEVQLDLVDLGHHHQKE